MSYLVKVKGYKPATFGGYTYDKKGRRQIILIWTNLTWYDGDNWTTKVFDYECEFIRKPGKVERWIRKTWREQVVERIDELKYKLKYRRLFR